MSDDKAGVPEKSELEKDAADLLFALIDAWPYVHESCTIKSKRDRISALLRKHGDFADLYENMELPDEAVGKMRVRDSRTGKVAHFGELNITELPEGLYSLYTSQKLK